VQCIQIGRARKVVAPHGLAGELRLFRVGQDRLANLRIDAVGAHHHGKAIGAAVGERDGDAIGILVQRRHGQAQPDFCAQFPGAVAQHALERAAADADVGRAAFDQRGRGHARHAGAIGNVDFHRVKAAGGIEKGIEDAQLVHRPDHVGLLDDAHAIDRPGRILFDDGHAVAGASQRDRGRQAADTGTHHQNGQVLHVRSLPEGLVLGETP
jgi:hypothetical protein